MNIEARITEVEEATAGPPLVFAQPITVPPGLPWDQAKAARLEAVRAAPAPIENLTLQLKRLQPWRPGSNGRYAALYVKRNEVGAGFSTQVIVGEQSVTADFRPREQLVADARRVTLVIAAGAASVLLGVVAMTTAVVGRAQTTAELDRLEQLAMRNLAQARSAAQLRRQADALRAIPNGGADLAQVLADLAWVSEARTPGAPVEAFHWRPRGVGLAVRGDASPLAESVARRSEQPLRPGVWLWIVGRPVGNVRASSQ